MEVSIFKVKVLKLLVIFIISFGAILAMNINKDSDLAYDEMGWYNFGKKLFRLYFIEHDFKNSLWHQKLQNYGSKSLKTGLYIIASFDLLIEKVQNLIPYKGSDRIFILRIFMVINV